MSLNVATIPSYAFMLFNTTNIRVCIRTIILLIIDTYKFNVAQLDVTPK